jgi:endonuclease/exonuclease/phosphatase family metal-dependent hydrolase
MRLLSWNVNHRASRRRVPPWVALAIAEKTPDVVVLTEYVEGVDHGAFVCSLATIGIACVSVSRQPGRENQVLMASRDAHRRLDLEIPEIHPAVPSNALAIELRDQGPRILGFRMPAFSRRDADRKRATWEWLLELAETLSCAPTVLTGDFNTAPGDPSPSSATGARTAPGVRSPRPWSASAEMSPLARA